MPPPWRQAAFGSILREDLDAGRSDIDILVEFDPSVAASFTNFLNLKEALEALFRRSVDLVELRVTVMLGTRALLSRKYFVAHEVWFKSTPMPDHWG